MKRRSLQQGSWCYRLISALLAALLVLGLSPGAVGQALAKAREAFPLAGLRQNEFRHPYTSTPQTQAILASPEVEAQMETDEAIPIQAEPLVALREESSASWPSIAILASPDQDTQVTSPSGKITVRIPKGAVAASTKIELTERAPTGSTGMRILNLFELNAWDSASGAKVTQFNANLTISITHDPAELTGINIDSLRLYSLDEKTRRWLPISTSQYDQQQKILTATTNHFTLYGEQADPVINGPGRVMAAEADLHSGAAIFSYPLELPPGPGGFRPKLELTYNSGSVDEMKNKRSMGSWVGIGWTLHLGRISRDLDTDQYFLELNGASYELVSSDGTNYRTNPDQYFKITRNGNKWELWDREGVYYRFGETTDSKQYIGSDYYRWDLSLMKDTNNNQATVSYQQSTKSSGGVSWVRSAYPEYLNYRNVEVEFKESSTTARNDNPEATDANPEPAVMEDRRLDAIEIRISSTLVRKYTFAYNTTDSVYSDDYGGIYYSGKHKLTSITQVGANGTSQLPAMSFSYEDKQTYRKGSADENTYTGNPGNPADFSWPHLTTVNSGYGGSVSFSYTQTPDTTATSIWTREAVTGRTIDGGIGANQSYTYTYTGNPKYLGNGWDQKYRGFPEVKETDAANNYVKHYFYTTGTVGGKDAEKLSGLEYKTQWFSSSDALLQEKVYDWTWPSTSQIQDFLSIWSSDGQGDGLLSTGAGIAVSSDAYVYVTDQTSSASNADRVQRFDEHGNFVLKWGTYGTGDGQFNNPEGVAISSGGHVYVVDRGNNRVQKFDSNGTFVTKWGSSGTGDGQFNAPYGIAVSSDGYVYIADRGNNRVQKFDANGTFIRKWGSYGTGNGQFKAPTGIAVSSDGYVYVTDKDNNRVQKFDSNGTYILKWGSSGTGNGQFSAPYGVGISSDGHVYVVDQGNSRIQEFNASGTFIRKWDGLSNPRYAAVGTNSLYVTGSPPVKELTYNWTVRLSQVDETIGSKTARMRYAYDSYGSVITEYRDGDISTNADDATVWRAFYPNTTANILSRPARQRVYATIVTSDSGGSNLKQETLYYYDDATSYTTPPTKGNLTRLEQKKDASNSVSSYYTYDSYGNMLTSQDPNNNITTWTYDSYGIYPLTKTYPITGLSESYTWDYGTDNLLTKTAVNGQTTTYKYDTFKRLTKVIKPGDSEASPSIEYQYNNWGTLNQQHLKTLTKLSGSDYIWQSQYFDGIGRVVQVQARGETGRTIISATTAFNNVGLVDKQYVSQDLDSSQVSGYKAPETGWKYASYAYDGLGRVTTQTNADGTTVSNDYSTAWQDLVTNERGYKKCYYFDAFQRLVKVEELNDSQQVYATTNYSYDVLDNLAQVQDNSSSNTTSMTYDWLSRKTAMTDPDMGSWSYGYDSNSNLTSQTDAKSQTISFTYDNLNRLTGKTYPQGSGMTNVTYTYDSTTGGNYGKGKRTGMTDALGTTSYKYDTRGRLIEEKRNVDSVDYTTSFTYDGADRLATVTYPTGEVVTNGYNGRGFPYSVSGSVVGNLVTSTSYNNLGSVTEINLGNSLRTIFGYWDVGGSYDTTGGYYGRLWEIKTLPQSGGTALQDVKHTWDAGGNLSQRQDVLASETESFGYDFLDRLTSVSGPYTESYAYNQIGNITSKNGTSYTYSTKPHAVTAVGSTSYVYDDNGNMTTRGTQTITWDVENRPVTITGGASFVYDGDGNRGKKTENSETVLYINKYYEKNLTTSEVSTYYYLGDRLMAMRKGTTLDYIHEDHLTGTSAVSDSSGASVGSIKFYPYGATRSGSVPTDKKFTGQSLDGTGLYYYGARYYDSGIGRFISADTTVPDYMNPQSFNRYSYCLNNPLEYSDPTGHRAEVRAHRASPNRSKMVVVRLYGQIIAIHGGTEKERRAFWEKVYPTPWWARNYQMGSAVARSLEGLDGNGAGEPEPKVLSWADEPVGLGEPSPYSSTDNYLPVDKNGTYGNGDDYGSKMLALVAFGAGLVAFAIAAPLAVGFAGAAILSSPTVAGCITAAAAAAFSAGIAFAGLEVADEALYHLTEGKYGRYIPPIIQFHGLL